MSHVLTNYPGVRYRMVKRKGGKGEEKVFYVKFKRGRQTIEAKVGGQYTDQMTPAKASKIRADMIEGRIPTPAEKREKSRETKWTFNALWNAYAETKEAGKTFETDRLRYMKHLKKNIGTKTPADLKPLDLERVKRIQCKDLAPQTQKHIIALVVRLARFGQKNNYCAGLAFIPELPKVNNEKTEDLMKTQQDRLLNVLNSWPDQNVAGLFKLAMVTGMRRGELFKLQWDHINFERKRIRLVDPKGGKDAEIPLNDAARHILLTLPERKDAKGSPYVFPGKNGNQRKSIQHTSRKIRKAASLPDDFRMCHGLRHFFASELASSGKVEIYVLQKLMTHREPRMTERYAHLRNETLQTASAVANGILEGCSLRAL